MAAVDGWILRPGCDKFPELRLGWGAGSTAGLLGVVGGGQSEGSAGGGGQGA